MRAPYVAVAVRGSEREKSERQREREKLT